MDLDLDGFRLSHHVYGFGLSSAHWVLKHFEGRIRDSPVTHSSPPSVSHSGGQRARVALARAVYARAKVTVLDDPLSALDARMSSEVGDQIGAWTVPQCALHGTF